MPRKGQDETDQCCDTDHQGFVDELRTHVKSLLEGYEISAELDCRQKVDDGRDAKAEGAPGLDDVFLEQDHVDFGAGRSGHEHVERKSGAGEPVNDGDQQSGQDEEGDAGPGQREAEQAILVGLGAAAEVAQAGGREDRKDKSGRDEHENEDAILVTHGTIPLTLRGGCTLHVSAIKTELTTKNSN